MCDLCVGSTSLEEDAHTKGDIGVLHVGCSRVMMCRDVEGVDVGPSP